MLKGEKYCWSPTKRMMDVVIATGGIDLSSPLWLAIYLYNQRRAQPTFFIQQRLGVGGDYLESKNLK